MFLWSSEIAKRTEFDESLFAVVMSLMLLAICMATTHSQGGGD